MDPFGIPRAPEGIPCTAVDIFGIPRAPGGIPFGAPRRYRYTLMISKLQLDNFVIHFFFIKMIIY